MRKRLLISALASVVFCFALLCGCAEENSVSAEPFVPEEGQVYFDALVKETNGNTLTVECVMCPDSVISVGSLVSFAPSRAADAESISDFHVGQYIRVVYDGSVMETYPLQLGVVYGVYPADGAIYCE